MAKNVKGTCHLCGSYEKLSFEHLPPEKAFNDCSIKLYNHFIGTPGQDCDYKISQRGLGRYTLCENCNNNTGSWYGDAFVEWACQSMDVLKYTENRPSLYYRFRIFPLRVLKQIACMMFSVNDHEFRLYHQDLVKFVLNKEERYLNSDIRFFAFFNAKGFRTAGGMVQVDTNNFNMDSPESLGEIAGRVRAKIESQRAPSEIAFPPLGYVLAVDSEQLDYRLIDISYFAKYRYEDKCSIELRLPVLPIGSPYSMDYRNRQDIEHSK